MRRDLLEVGAIFRAAIREEANLPALRSHRLDQLNHPVGQGLLADRSIGGVVSQRQWVGQTQPNPRRTGRLRYGRKVPPRQHRRVGTHLRQRHAGRAEPAIPDRFRPLVADGDVGYAAIGEGSLEQHLSTSRPVVGNPDAIDAQGNVGESGLGKGTVDLGRKVQIGVSQQIAAAKHNRVEPAERFAPLRSKAPLHGKAQGRANPDLTHNPRSVLQQGEDRTAVLEAFAVGGPARKIDGSGLHARRSQFGFQAFGQQAVAEVRAVLHIQRTHDHPGTPSKGLPADTMGRG